MKLPENTIVAIFAVYSIATVCSVLVIGGLYMTVPGDEHGHHDLTVLPHSFPAPAFAALKAASA